MHLPFTNSLPFSLVIQGFTLFSLSHNPSLELSAVKDLIRMTDVCNYFLNAFLTLKHNMNLFI